MCEVSGKACVCVMQICDFGLAKWKAYSRTNTNSRRKRTGTVTHIPPESWHNINHPRTVKYDVYSFAVLLWELFAAEKPYKYGIICNSSVDSRLVKILFGFESKHFSVKFYYFFAHIFSYLVGRHQ